METTEVRTLTGGELRAVAGNKLAGVAVVYGALSEDLGGFQEMFLAGAFADWLKSSPDVRALWNHNTDAVLGRTRNGTLRLTDTATGLRFEVDLPSTTAGQDARASIQRGDISQCSFGFLPRKQKWTTNGTRREIQQADLFEISPCTFPAYPQTFVSVRALGRGVTRYGAYTVTGALRREPPAITIPADPRLQVARMRLQCRLASADNER